MQEKFRANHWEWRWKSILSLAQVTLKLQGSQENWFAQCHSQACRLPFGAIELEKRIGKHIMRNSLEFGITETFLPSIRKRKELSCWGGGAVSRQFWLIISDGVLNPSGVRVSSFPDFEVMVVRFS